MQDSQQSQFTVTLCDYPQLPEPERQRAEARYARVLERHLGGTAQVAEIFSAVQQLEDAAPDEVSDHMRQLYGRWAKAARLATEAGMQGLGEGEGSFFEIRRCWQH